MLMKIFHWGTPQKTEGKVTVSTAETPIRTDLAFRLRNAEERFNAAASKKQLTEKQLVIADANIQALDKILRNFEVPSREMRISELQQAKAREIELRKHMSLAESECDAADSQLFRVRSELACHPKYAAALSEQKRLASEAAKFVKGSWDAPLSDIPSLIARFDAVADEEIRFVQRTNSLFIRLGLPELRDRITACREALPLFVLQFPFDTMRRGAWEFMKRLSSLSN